MKFPQKFQFLLLLFREDLLSRPDPINEQFVNPFVIVATHYLVGGLGRGLIKIKKQISNFSHLLFFLVERSYFTDVINVGKLLLKYLLQNILPKITETNRVTMNLF
jgi:hypothetical protein